MFFIGFYQALVGLIWLILAVIGTLACVKLIMRVIKNFDETPNQKRPEFLNKEIALNNFSKTSNLLEGLKGGPEFLNKDKTVIVFNENVDGNIIIQSIRRCIETNFWAKRTRIVILCGFHTSNKGEMGESYAAFQGTISKHLDKLEIELAKQIEEMEYEIETLVLLTVPYEGEDKKIRYRLDSCGKRNLKSKSSNCGFPWV